MWRWNKPYLIGSDEIEMILHERLFVFNDISRRITMI